MDIVGKNTSRLFLYAIETSGSGPPKGYIHLDEEYQNKKKPEGIAAFLRAVQTYVPEMSLNGRKTIEEYMQEKGIQRVVESTELDFVNSVSTANESVIDICKVPVNPMVILLHVDQGSFASGKYTPFATPQSNNRTIHSEYVERLTTQLLDKQDVIKTEDFAIAPYMVHLVNATTQTTNQTGVLYRCTLDRDRESKQNIIAKEAQTITLKVIKGAREVSEQYKVGSHPN
jgi:hypothetical protein